MATAIKDNEVFKDIRTLVNEVVEETDINAGFTKSLPTFGMSDVEGQRTGDIEYMTEDYRFEAKDGIVSDKTHSDTQKMIDRLIGIKRTKAIHIKSAIKTKELRDPRMRDQAVKGYEREIRNAIDKYSQRKVINRATMLVKETGDITQATASAAEVLMMDNGLGAYSKNLFLSLPHYKKLNDKLALNQYHNGVPQTALERAQIPNQIGGFNKCWRSDYRMTLPAAKATGVTVAGDQSHTVKTRDANDVPIDNRVMQLAVSSGTDFVVGDKITIDGINRLNPEVREDTGEVMQFTVVDKLNNTLTISPAIIVDGPYRNCSAIAADGSAITNLNEKDNNPSIFWAENSIKLISGALPVGGVNMKKWDVTTAQGIPFRFTSWYEGDEEVLILKCVAFFDCEVWLPNQVGLILDKQTP